MRVFDLSAANVLEQLINSNVRLRVVEGQLQVKANGGLTSDMREQIWRNKRGLVELVLAGEHRWGPGEGWESGEDGDWPEGSRLDESEYIRWGLYDDDW